MFRNCPFQLGQQQTNTQLFQISMHKIPHWIKLQNKHNSPHPKSPPLILLSPVSQSFVTLALMITHRIKRPVFLNNDHISKMKLFKSGSIECLNAVTAYSIVRVCSVLTPQPKLQDCAAWSTQKKLGSHLWHPQWSI